MSSLTVIIQVHHIQDDGTPTTADVRFSERSGEDETPTVYKDEVGKDWVGLDMGRLKGHSLIVIQNAGNTAPQRVPTREEREESTRGVIEVAVSMGHAGDEEEHISPVICTIPPGRSLPWQLVDPSTIRIRCNQDNLPSLQEDGGTESAPPRPRQVTYKVYVFPKSGPMPEPAMMAAKSPQGGGLRHTPRPGEEDGGTKRLQSPEDRDGGGDEDEGGE